VVTSKCLNYVMLTARRVFEDEYEDDQTDVPLPPVKVIDSSWNFYYQNCDHRKVFVELLSYLLYFVLQHANFSFNCV